MATLIFQLENLSCFPKMYGFLIFWIHILKNFIVFFNYLYWPYFYPRTLVFLKWETQIQAGSVKHLLAVEKILFFLQKTNICNEFFGRQGQTISDDKSKYGHLSRCINLMTIEKLNVKLKVHHDLEKFSTVNDHRKKYHDFVGEETVLFHKVSTAGNYVKWRYFS